MNSSQTSPSSLKSFNILQKLGEGSFASVYKVQRIDDNKLYAMKKVKISEMKEKQRDNALNQVRVLASISHPNIVNYKQAFFDDASSVLCIVMELADAGDIQKKINQHIKNHSHFTQAQIWQAFIQMSKGLKALHQINILHRDLKCANVFCTKDHKYKLGDLNVSKVAKRGMARTQTGTPYYTSPEVWKDKPYDSKCDIWSLGCVIYEMASLSPPFRANNLKQLYTKIQRGIFQRIPSFYSDDLAQMINLCLKVNPINRPSAQQILQHNYIIKNAPSSQKYGLDADLNKKVNLIGTILCPRNLKSLKMALPGAKYEDLQQNKQKLRPTSVDGSRENKRANSARNNYSRPVMNPVNQIPRVINSPKVGQMVSKDIKYALQRRPSSSQRNNVLPLINKKQAYSQLRQRQRQNSRNLSRNNSKLVRNNSVDSIRKRQDSNRSIENNNSFRRKQQRSIQKVQDGRIFIDDIANKCRNIRQKMQMLVNKVNGAQPRQKVSNSYQKRYNLPEVSSRQKRQPSTRSRNNSIQIKQNVNNPAQKVIVRGNSERSLERNRSIQRMERPNSRKAIEPRYMPYRR